MPELPTVNIDGIEVFASGVYNGDRYSNADLDAMVDAFDKVGFKPIVKAGHEDAQEDPAVAKRVFGSPSLGYVSRIYRQGNKLLADFTKVPRRFADLVKAGSFSRISSEIFWNYSHHDGQKFPRVLKACAFLGASVPALTNLKEIECLFQKDESGLLHAYDEEGREFRTYDIQPEHLDYKETGTFTIEKEGDGYCVYNPQGEKVKTWPTLEAAKKSLEGYNSKVVGESEGGDEEDTEDYAKTKKGKWVKVPKKTKIKMVPPPPPGMTHPIPEPPKRSKRFSDDDDEMDIHSYVIRKRGDQYCLMTHDGEKVIGCHDSMEKAQRQEAAVQANKHSANEVWATVEQMRELCPDCAERMEFNSIQAVKLGHYAEDGSFLPENTKSALCDKFRTRCMASSVANNVDDPGAFCNSLKMACHGSASAESGKKKMSQHHTGGGLMDHDENKALDERIKEQIDKALAQQAKEYERQMEYRVHKAREDAKADAEKDAEMLREDIRKLQMEKRSERIEGWLKRMKAEGKLTPAEESKVRALREWLPDEEQGLKFFTLKNGKTEEHTSQPAELFESLFEQRPSMFRVLSEKGTMEEETGQELEDPGQEVDRRAKRYQASQKANGTEVSYSAAVSQVCKQDAELARRYHNLGTH